MNPPRRLRGTFGMCNLREGFVNLREGFVVAPWRLREAFSKTRSAKASRSPLEGFAKAPRAPLFGNDSSDNDKPPQKHTRKTHGSPHNFPPHKGGSYGNKILYKNLKFFDKIFVRKSCRRRFRNAPYGEKILLMGKSYVWA